ncbi:MAG: MotA/TolQ/ExbB proton channel, partial [Planctomycetota bacterium]
MDLELITRWFTPAILVLGGLHLLLFLYLWAWARRDMQRLAHLMVQLSEGIQHRSRLDWEGHLSDQIDAFVTDVTEALERDEDHAGLAKRISDLDQR